MSRTIKFRAWNTKLQKMMKWYPFIRFDNSEYVVQQFTGLLDAKGKEIYEFDILKYQSSDPRFAQVVVRWTKEEEDNHPGWVVSDSYCQYGKPEIVGNIFENSELVD